MKNFLILYSAPNNIGITVGMGYIPLEGSYGEVLCWIRYDKVKSTTEAHALIKAKPRQGEKALNAVQIH